LSRLSPEEKKKKTCRRLTACLPNANPYAQRRKTTPFATLREDPHEANDCTNGTRDYFLGHLASLPRTSNARQRCKVAKKIIASAVRTIVRFMRVLPQCCKGCGLPPLSVRICIWKARRQSPASLLFFLFWR